MPSEAWGFRHGDDVEYRSRFADIAGAIGYRDPDDDRFEWHRAKIVGITSDKTLLVKIVSISKTLRVNNPKLVRHWKAPQTPDEIERFLNG